jgi:hypothetical protein
MEDRGDSAICARPLRMRPQATAPSLIDGAYALRDDDFHHRLLQCSIDIVACLRRKQ